MIPRFPLVVCLLSAVAMAAMVSFSHAAPVLVLDSSHLDLPQRQLAASLQGIANRNPEAPRVFVLQGRWDAAWLEYALRFSGQSTESVSLEGLLEAVRPYLKGQVLYDPARSYTLAVATTAAGASDVAVTAEDLSLPTLYDLRGRWGSSDEAYGWAAATLLPRGRRARIALLSSDNTAMRDYAVHQGMFVISPPEGPAGDRLRDVLYRFSPGTEVFGEEAPNLRPVLDQLSFHLVPAAEAANLSFYSTIEVTRLYQYPGHLEPIAPRYLTIILDCADLGFAVNEMPDLWEYPGRGSLPLGWALPGALATAAPPIAHRYYADAYRSGTDQFVLDASAIAASEMAPPEAFYRTLAEAADALDAHTALWRLAPAEEVATAVAQVAAEEHLRGVFLLTSYDQAPALYGGVPTLATPRVETVQQAITYLDRLPLERRFAALCLDSRTLGPADAAHIAAHVASRYVVVPPVELMTLMLSAALPPQGEPPAITIASVQYPVSPLDPTTCLPIKAEIVSLDNVSDVSVVYRAANSRFAFNQPMTSRPEGFGAELPPIRWGGPVELKVRATDRNGNVAWSPLWTIEVARQDSDADGLSEAEESFLLTDPERPDTDGDGMTDANDTRPLEFERHVSRYFGPITPPSDLPYITNPAQSTVTADSRVLQPGQGADYWLPTSCIPPDGSAVIRLVAEGQAAIAVGSDSLGLTGQFEGEVEWRWHSAALSRANYPSNVYLRITCPEEAPSSLVLRSLELVSPPDAPSVTQVGRVPAYPGPEQPITVSALVFGPEGVAETTLVYQVNGRGRIMLPMVGQGQRYCATLPALENQDLVEYWLVARDASDRTHVTPVTTLWIGGRGREVVSLLARRDFIGGWRPSPEWNHLASLAPEVGVQDTAAVNLTGGTYALWVLAGGRGNGITVSVDGRPVGAVAPNQPDGWQRAGRVRLEAGRHHVALASQPASDQTTWSAPRYAAVILSTDSTFEPPDDQVFDVVNSLILLSPDVGEPLTGAVDLRATGAGNLLGVEFSLDGELLRRVSGPPFLLRWNTSRHENGAHTLRLETVDRTGPTGFALEFPVIIANP